MWTHRRYLKRMLPAVLLVVALINPIDLSCAQIGNGSDPAIFTSTGAAKLDNESISRDLLNSTWAQYQEDLNYSSVILTQFVKKNITEREAMIATTSLLLLASQTLANLNKLRPAKRYADSYNDTILALSNLGKYMWNISKYYETEKASYAINARENYNNSSYYFERAREKILRSKKANS